MNFIYITGTSRGIGKAIAEKLLDDEENVVYGFSRSEDEIEHPNYIHTKLDLSDPEDMQMLNFDEHKGANKIVLINNAGTLGDIKYVGDSTSEEIIDAYAVNVIAPAVLTNSFIDAYRQYDAEKLIINVTSGAGQRPIDGWGVYCSSKAAMDMYTQVLDLEQQTKGRKVKVLGIAPGVVDTQMQSEIREADESEFSNVERFVQYKEDGLLNSPEEVAAEYVKFINDPSLADDLITSVGIDKRQTS